MKYLVVGLGKTGYSVIKFLRTHGESVEVVDTRSHPPYWHQVKHEFAYLNVHLGFKPTRTNYYNKFDYIVVSPGIPLSSLNLEKVPRSKIIGDLEIFYHHLNYYNPQAKIIAITGSNGKTTVTTLVGDIMSANGYRVAVGGNIGVPVLDLLSQDKDIYVLEVSSFQLELMHEFSADAAVVLNLSPDHMDRYDNIQEYYNVKLGIYTRAKKIIYNVDDQNIDFVFDRNKQYFSFGLSSACEQGVVSSYRLVNNCIIQNEKTIISCSELKVLGQHNYLNIMASLALCESMGLQINSDYMSPTQLSIKEFKGLEHRCEKVVIKNNILWVNDSKATNVDSTLAALKGLVNLIKGKWIIILGGQTKGVDMHPLVDILPQHCKEVYIIGVDALAIAKRCESTINYEMCPTLEDAVMLATKRAKSGDGVLLSPACASLDMFSGFAERGNKFKQAIALYA